MGRRKNEPLQLRPSIQQRLRKTTFFSRLLELRATNRNDREHVSYRIHEALCPFLCIVTQLRNEGRNKTCRKLTSLFDSALTTNFPTQYVCLNLVSATSSSSSSITLFPFPLAPPSSASIRAFSRKPAWTLQRKDSAKPMVGESPRRVKDPVAVSEMERKVPWLFGDAKKGEKEERRVS